MNTPWSFSWLQSHGSATLVMRLYRTRCCCGWCCWLSGQRQEEPHSEVVSCWWSTVTPAGTEELRAFRWIPAKVINSYRLLIACEVLETYTSGQKRRWDRSLEAEAIKNASEGCLPEAHDDRIVLWCLQMKKKRPRIYNTTLILKLNELKLACEVDKSYEYNRKKIVDHSFW